MELKTKLKKALEETYHIDFSVAQTRYTSPLSYMIRLSGSNSNYFQIDVVVKEDTRLTIECSPEQYGAGFVEIISNSSQNQRERFLAYLERISEIGKTSLKIDDVPCSAEEFKRKTPPWKKFDVRFTKPAYYDVEREDQNTVIAQYVSMMCGMMLSLVDYEIEGYEEGAVIERVSKKYERNPLNRMLCLHEKGYKCIICGFDFHETYGDIGKEFIHIHHSLPVSEMGDNHVVNITKELFPVCPNCHAMLHKKTPPYTIDELKSMIKR